MISVIDFQIEKERNSNSNKRLVKGKQIFVDSSFKFL
jgi:hypothetical protein